MLLRKAVRALASHRKEGRRDRRESGRGGHGSHSASRDRSVGVAASKPDVSADPTSSNNMQGFIDGDNGGGVGLGGGCGLGVSPGTTAASSGKACLQGKLKGLCEKQEQLLGSQATLVERHADVAKCLGEQGREIASVGEKIADVGTEIQGVLEELASVSGGSPVESGKEEPGDEEHEEAGEILGLTKAAPDDAEAIGKSGITEVARVEDGGVGLDEPATVEPSSGADVKHGVDSEGGGAKVEDVGFDEPAAVVQAPLERGMGSPTDRSGAYRSKKRKRQRRKRRKRRGSIAPVRNGHGGTGCGVKVEWDGGEGNGGAKISRVAKFLWATAVVMLSGLATQGSGLMTFGQVMGEAPPALLDQENWPANIPSSRLGKSVDLFEHVEEHPREGEGAAFWKTFVEKKQVRQQPWNTEKSEKIFGPINDALDERELPGKASFTKNPVRDSGGDLPSPKRNEKMTKIIGRDLKINHITRTDGRKSLLTKPLKSKDGARGPGPRILQETDLPVLYYFKDGTCSFEPSGLPDPSNGGVLFESIDECCEAEYPQGMAKRICIAFSQSPPDFAGSIFDADSPVTSSSPTVLPIAANGVATASEGMFTPTGQTTTSPGTESPLATLAPPGTADNPTAVGEESAQTDIPTYVPESGPANTVLPTASDGAATATEGIYTPTGQATTLPGTTSPLAISAHTPSYAPTRLRPFQNVNFYCVPDPSTCGCMHLRGSDYRGKIGTTKSGLACHRWDSFDDTIYFEDDDDYAHNHDNHCRNPNDPDRNGPWCYTKEDGSEWDYCDVPACVTNVCNADPLTCGCPHLSQADYRGSINVTSSGHSCISWNETSWEDADVIRHGLEENHCRNPDQDGNGPWCDISENGDYDYCDVPACSTSPYICDASPDTCGCLDLRGSDFRGSTNLTISGLPCVRWDMAYGADDLERYSSSGLEGNFCRNPDNEAGGPWCFTSKEGVWEYCDVPVCSSVAASPNTSPTPTSSPRPTAVPSASLSPTQTCQAADKGTCGCDVVSQSDYRGSISTTRVGLECMIWDSEQFRATMGFDAIDFYPNSDLESNFCHSTSRNDPPLCYTALPFEDAGDAIHVRKCNIPTCPACSCQPPCGQPNEADCGCPSVLQADSCCEDVDSSCRCGYLKDACRKSIEKNSTEFCDTAEEECCKGRNDPNCKCHMYEQICSEGTSNSTCQLAADRCCEHDDDTMERDICLCDFYTHIQNTHSFESEYHADYCYWKGFWAAYLSGPAAEKEALEGLYYWTGGGSWRKNTGWLVEDTSYCDWYGIVCNEENRVFEINLEQNNLTVLTDDGNFFSALVQLSELTYLDLGENKLSGKIRSDYLFFQSLRHVNLSGNDFSGHIDMSLFSTASYIYLAHNKLTSVSFTPLISKRDAESINFEPHVAPYKSLRVIDLSNNLINEKSLEFFIDIPPKLERLILSQNAISGPLPNPLPSLERLEYLHMDNNHLNGTSPHFHRSTPSLRQLDLSNQANGGLTGSIPATFSKLDDISVLNLGGNNFYGAIPDTFGNFEQIKTLNLSSNALDQSIPLTLRKLEGTINVLDLSSNQLNGSIPFQLGDLEGTSIYLSGNLDLSNPAPLSLCFLPNIEFDLKNDTGMCPPERNALRDFYDSSKGQEWTETDLWGDEYISHCSWLGVTCDSTNSSTIALELPSNGLSGTLSERIQELSSLEVLDVSDNDINGPIPKGIGHLSNLTKLFLKYNAFSDEVPEELGALTHLESIQLQSNELTGAVPHVAVVDPNSASSFVADCGYPSDFETALVCDNCTTCCNNEGGCIPTADNTVKKSGFQNYMIFSGFFLGIILAACAVLSLVVFVFDRSRMDRAFALITDESISRRNFILQQASLRKEEDREYGKKIAGDDSVYCFFMGKSRLGWMIVVATVAVQMWLLFVFVQGAEIDWTEEAVDFVYQDKCPKDQEVCETTSDLTPQGWALFWVLMAAYLLPDFINGIKLLVLSGQERHKKDARVRFFFGGVLLTMVTTFTLFVSVIYNSAIATSDTDIIMNSVIILFFTEIDELIFGILEAISEDWVDHMSLHQNDGEGQEPAAETRSPGKDDEEEGSEFVPQHLDQQGGSKTLAEEVQSLKSMLKTLRGQVDELQKENFKLKSPYGAPQEDSDSGDVVLS